jgi:hypothetical protein
MPFPEHCYQQGMKPGNTIEVLMMNIQHNETESAEKIPARRLHNSPVGTARADEIFYRRDDANM